MGIQRKEILLHPCDRVQSEQGTGRANFDQSNSHHSLQGTWARPCRSLGPVCLEDCRCQTFQWQITAVTASFRFPALLSLLEQSRENTAAYHYHAVSMFRSRVSLLWPCEDLRPVWYSYTGWIRCDLMLVVKFHCPNISQKLEPIPRCWCQPDDQNVKGNLTDGRHWTVPFLVCHSGCPCVLNRRRNHGGRKICQVPIRAATTRAKSCCDNPDSSWWTEGEAWPYVKNHHGWGVHNSPFPPPYLCSLNPCSGPTKCGKVSPLHLINTGLIIDSSATGLVSATTCTYSHDDLTIWSATTPVSAGIWMGKVGKFRADHLPLFCTFDSFQCEPASPGGLLADKH